MNTQRGFGVVVYLIAAAVLAAAVLGWGQYRYSQGVASERTRNLNAVFEKEQEMSILRRKHDAELEALARRFSNNAAVADARIRDLLQTNKALLGWWRGVVPADASDYAWLRPTDSDPVRGGPDIIGAATASGEAGTPN